MIDKRQAFLFGAEAEPDPGPQPSQARPEPPSGDEIRGLSFRQPWLDAIFWNHPLAKRVENRTGWKDCAYRGRVLLHASNTLLRYEHAEVAQWARDRSIPWQPPPVESFDKLRGGFVGRARIVGVVRPIDDVNASVERDWPDVHDAASARDATAAWWREQHVWWMGGFALVLADVEPIEFIEFKGMLGLFRVPPEIIARVTPRARG